MKHQKPSLIEADRKMEIEKPDDDATMQESAVIAVEGSDAPEL
jgi:hypothetical protein